MRQVNLHEAAIHLSDLLDAVEAGERVLLARGDRPVAELIPYVPVSRRRTLGLFPGQARVPADFDESPADLQVTLGPREG